MEGFCEFWNEVVRVERVWVDPSGFGVFPVKSDFPFIGFEEERVHDPDGLFFLIVCAERFSESDEVDLCLFYRQFFLNLDFSALDWIFAFFEVAAYCSPLSSI